VKKHGEKINAASAAVLRTMVLIFDRGDVDVQVRAWHVGKVDDPKRENAPAIDPAVALRSP